MKDRVIHLKPYHIEVVSARILTSMVEEQLRDAQKHALTIESQRVCLKRARMYLVQAQTDIVRALASLDLLDELIDVTDGAQACAYAEMRR